MNTKKILLITSDSELNGIIKISALTLTKLNCQVSIIEAVDIESAMTESASSDLSFIILDLDINNFDAADFIKKIRANTGTAGKKIISVYSGLVDLKKFHSAGCDSIMSKEEFRKVVVNILKY